MVSVQDDPREPPPDSGSRAGTSRLRIMQLLRQAPDGLGVQELAERVGLHVNTVRFHLDRLVAEGVVARHAEERTEPGRPRHSFTAVAGPGTHPDLRSYRLLAEMLAGLVTESLPDPEAAATEAGRAWGHYLASRPRPYRRADEETSVAELLRLMDDIGFVPQLAPAEQHREIRLRHCPFLEVAEEHREVVCSLHLGLMQGALAEMRAPIVTERLLPLVEPALCVAVLGPAAPRPGRPG
jgi:predicted ArsR family transcriptional regulator